MPSSRTTSRLVHSELQTIQSLYLLQQYPVSRPKALLGDEHLRNLRAQIAAVRAAHPAGTFTTLKLNAAGSDSTVMMRLKTEIARAEGLEVGEDEGDLMMRVRPTPSTSASDEAWDVLVRLSPRPLATRAWRVCNFEGAMNAAVAHALVRLTHPNPRDVYLNIACGSGTLLAERLLAGPSRQIIGCDIQTLEANGFTTESPIIVFNQRLHNVHACIVNPTGRHQPADPKVTASQIDNAADVVFRDKTRHEFCIRPRGFVI